MFSLIFKAEHSTILGIGETRELNLTKKENLSGFRKIVCIDSFKGKTVVVKQSLFHELRLVFYILTNKRIKVVIRIRRKPYNSNGYCLGHQVKNEMITDKYAPVISRTVIIFPHEHH